MSVSMDYGDYNQYNDQEYYGMQDDEQRINDERVDYEALD